MQDLLGKFKSLNSWIHPFIAAALVVLGSSAMAQSLQVKPERLQLAPGSVAQITLSGSQFTQIKQISVTRNKRPTRDLSARSQIRGRQAVVSVSAGPQASGAYLLEIYGIGKPVIVPVNVVRSKVTASKTLPGRLVNDRGTAAKIRATKPASGKTNPSNASANPTVGGAPADGPPVQPFVAVRTSSTGPVRSGDQLEYKLEPPLPMEWESQVSMRLVEAGVDLVVQGETSSERRYSVVLPPGLNLGPDNLEIRVGSQTTAAPIYVYPVTSPELVSVATEHGVDAGLGTYLHYNEPVVVTTNGGGFDTAKLEVLYPQGWLVYPLQRLSATTLTTYGAINFQSLGTLKMRLLFTIDAPPPEFVDGGLTGQTEFLFRVGQFQAPVYVAGRPDISACSTPGAPSHPHYANPIFPGVDFLLEGERLLLPGNGVSPTAEIGFSVSSINATAEIMPQSTAGGLTVRLPPNPTNANVGQVFVVNNGIVAGSSDTADCLPNRVVMQVHSVAPATIFGNPAATDVTISGPFLGWLAQSVTLNGVVAEIRQRNDHSLVVRWHEPVTSGDVVVETQAGTAVAAGNKARLGIAGG